MNILARTKRHLRLTLRNYGLGEQLGERPSPPFLILFINSICNQTCEHCFYWRNLNRKDDLTVDELRALSAELGTIENLNLSGGEPFLRKEFGEICRFFIQNNGVRQIYVPTNGTFTDRTIAALHADVSYRIAHHADLDDGPWVDVHEVGPGDELTVGSLALTVGSTDHRPVEPSVGYRFEHEGASVAVAGDGVPCDTLDALTRGATAYVQTVIRDDIVRQVPNARLQDILDYHSTVGQAAATASRAGVRYLILTHYVPAPAPGTEQEWRDLAVGFTGEVIVGDDLTSVEFTA